MPITEDFMQSHLTSQILKSLIGIPFKIGREDLKACDCVGICWLYHKLIHGKDYPHRDGKMLVIRDRRKDILRITNVIKTWATEVPFDKIQEGDIVLMKGDQGQGCLGVAVDRTMALHMQNGVGSRLSRLSELRQITLRVYHPHD
jgi:hypothetical protein